MLGLQDSIGDEQLGNRIAKFEQFESRRVCATLSGAVWIDRNGNSTVDAGDEPVAQAIVWVDSNRNGLRESSEPSTRSSASGAYSFGNLPAGDYEVRMQPPPGLFQTSPSEYFGFYKGSQPGSFGVADIDVDTGSVTPRTAAVASEPAFGLIKTVQGDYYGSSFIDDRLVRIDPVTGAQTKLPYGGLGIVGGLAYDPIMDKIYTLANDPADGDSPLNLYEFDRTTGGLTRVGTGEGVAKVRGTSAVTFDMVHREVVLFDNNLNEIIAYDLNGQGRKVFQFPGAMAFYNLAFDGHRLVTFQTDAQNVTRLYEVDTQQRSLKELKTLQTSLTDEAAEMLGVNQALTVHIESASSDVTDGIFLTNQMDLSSASLKLTVDGMKLTTDDGLNVEFPTVVSDVPILFCVANQPSQLKIQYEASPTPVQVSTSDFDDRVELTALPEFDIDMKSGRDTLAFSGTLHVDPAQLSQHVSGVEVIDITQTGDTRLAVSADSIRSFSPFKNLTVNIVTMEQLELSNQAWKVGAPRTGSGLGAQARAHQLTVDDVLLEVVDGYGWHNPLMPEDVNHDGDVTALDALLVINELNLRNPHELTTASTTDSDLAYVDPSGDNRVGAIDALLIINRLNG